MDWLDGTVPESDLLVTPPAHMFVVDELAQKRSTQSALKF
jgi:hypothetical protein